jgi:ABC-2 type transport system ATP-binding protein
MAFQNQNPETEPAIEVTQLTRDFGSLRALDEISFAVLPGEIFGFLGPNGAGKTTTLRILTGQLRPSAGWARVLGCDVVTERARLQPQIGVVFEHQNLYLRLSALDNLLFTARLYGAPRSRIDEVLHLVGLQARAKDGLNGFSKGMRQRLLIARALLPGPRVLFMDEPTRGLDPTIARSIRSLIAALAEAGMTIFLTTHYMEEADQLCSRVAILDRGRIAALDTPTALKAAGKSHGAVTLEDVFLQLTGQSLAQV